MHQRREVLAKLIRKLDEPHSFTLISGREQSGKSTLLQTFHESLLKRRDVITGFVQSRYREEPKVKLLSSLLASLYFRCSEKRKPERFREILANLEVALGELRQDQVIVSLFQATAASLQQEGLMEIAQNLEGFTTSKEQIFDLGIFLSKELTFDHLIRLVRILLQVIEDYKIVFIVDEADEREAWMNKDWGIERFHLYLAKDTEDQAEEGIKLATENTEFTEKEFLSSPSSYLSVTSVTSVAKNENSYTIKLEPLEISPKDHPSTKKILASCNQEQQETLFTMAILKYPLPLPELAKLLDFKETKCLDLIREFEKSLLLKRVYMEGENLFCFASQEKQKAVLDFGRESLGLESFHIKAGAYFANSISLPTLEAPSSFWTNLSLSSYHYGQAKEKDPGQFYSLALSGPSCWKELLSHSYFASLETPFKIIIYYYLVREGSEDLSILQEAARNLENEKLKIEYAKALFYLANYAGREGKFDRLIELISRAREFLDKNPGIHQIRVIYAHALTNASFDLASGKKFEKLYVNIEQLARMAETNQNADEIKVLYTRALAHTSKQLGRTEAMISILRDLIKENPGAFYLKVNCLKALVNLSFDLQLKDEGEEIKKIIEEMEALLEKDPDFTESRIALAKVIANLSLSLGREKKFKELENKLARLASMTNQEESQRRPEMAIIYGQALSNAASDLGEALEFETLKIIVDRIRWVAWEYPVVNLIYARALSNASLDCGEASREEEREQYLSSLESLAQTSSPFAKKLKVVQAKALACAIMIFGQQKDFPRIGAKTKLLNKLGKEAKSKEVLTICKQSLFNLTNYFGNLKEWENLKESLKELKDLENVLGEGQKSYLQALLNAILISGLGENFKQMEEYFHILQEEAKREGKVMDIYLKGLINACLCWGKAGRFDPLNLYLGRLSKACKEKRGDIIETYAYILLNTADALEKHGQHQELKEIIEKARLLMEGYPRQEMLKVTYAKILLNAYNNFSEKEELIEANLIINRIEEAATRHQEIKTFLKRYDFPLLK